MIGKIIKAQKEIYYVLANDESYMCKARGVFRNQNIKPLVGDNVEFEIREDNKGYINNILERKNEIKRPNIANIDQILYFVTIKNPSLNLFNIDKYLAMCEYINIDVAIILSKKDLAEEKDLEFIRMYENIGYKLIFIDNYNDFPKDKIMNLLKGKTSAVSGSSGVGKSTFLSNLVDYDIEIGSISEKSKRGKNTTRHIEIFNLGKNTNIFDTPGFDSFDLDFIDDEKNLKYCFKEFDNKSCKFNNCNHINEPKCKVKDDLLNGYISKTRYENYLTLFDDIKRRREKW
ncbi:ribosome small subunit-dependent GTPase A [Anaerococcus sp. AGMB00486]|uniref:Small ribosomal subunit biogenesis GTPase RsgA n=2 Tax=Anaerococcus TaxID=165779 RepID=A0ABX2N8N5_9FIRM|nr:MULTISPECIES: ribosome small subunit-dependent GTPase A [Anaerococcus]MDY3006179.1 ribosome small subunit-dependent GTPase A [Anaerococcus porci]MSS77153.1 ribosome small subunit-dependent GTPase A [Anaerococcus porci]NVF11043.1 ribosome small subunit-dependent GTPase A [Anaerococcus faecalis]